MRLRIPSYIALTYYHTRLVLPYPSFVVDVDVGQSVVAAQMVKICMVTSYDVNAQEQLNSETASRDTAFLRTSSTDAIAAVDVPLN